MDLAPDDPRARAALAISLAAANRLARAEEEARRGVTLGPGSAEAHLALSQVLRLRGSYDEALEEARRSADLDPGDPRTLVALGDVLRDQERLIEAMEMYGQAIDLDHEAVVPQLAAAATLLKGGRIAMARGIYNQLLDRWSYGTNRALLGAAALLVQMQDYEGAFEMYGRVPIPDNTSHTTILALYGKAYALLKQERDSEAEYFLTTLVTRVPRDWDGPIRSRDLLFLAYDDLVRFFDKRGRKDRVESLLRDAVARLLAPTRLARALARRLEPRRGGREATAILARAILGADPREDALEVADSALLLARLASRDGTRTIAPGAAGGPALRLAAERIASSPIGPAHYRLARAQSLAGMAGEALESLRRARAHGFLPADQAAAEPDLARLRDDPAFQTLLHD